MGTSKRSTSSPPASAASALAAFAGGASVVLAVFAGVGAWSASVSADTSADTAIPGVSLSGILAGASLRAPREIVTAALNEVRRGAVDGREFLTLSIDGRSVGPLACRGTVLRADTAELGDVDSRERIESAALSAMLGEEPVAITVPLEDVDCVDGKPTFTDLRPLPFSP